MSKKMEEVRDAGVRVVSEDFLTDIKSSGKALQELVSLHAISPWGAEVKVEANALSAATKSGALAAKSTGRVKEEEGNRCAYRCLSKCFRGVIRLDLCYSIGLYMFIAYLYINK